VERTPVLSIVYSSRAVTEFSDSDLAALLTKSRANNASVGMTGLLLYRDGRFVQLLEGPLTVVRERMEIIRRDPRHDEVEILLEEVLRLPRFPDWTMGYEPVEDARADDVPGYRTTFEEIAKGGTSGATTLALRELIEWFQAGSGGPSADS
jgi:hypothetical protein